MYRHIGQYDHTLFRKQQILVNRSPQPGHFATETSLRLPLKYGHLHFSYCERRGETDPKICPTTPDETLLSPPGRRSYEMKSPFCRDAKRRRGYAMVSSSNLKADAASKIRTYAGRSHLISRQTPKPLGHRSYDSKGVLPGWQIRTQEVEVCFL